jgi:uncharacterized protein DUF5403
MAEVYANCNDIVAHLPAVRAAVKRAADRAAALASGVLAEHRNTGDAEITVTKGTKTDYFVNLDDTRGQGAAAAIEFGHTAPDGTWVEGIHALTRSFR